MAHYFTVNFYDIKFRGNFMPHPMCLVKFHWMELNHKRQNIFLKIFRMRDTFKIRDLWQANYSHFEMFITYFGHSNINII